MGRRQRRSRGGVSRRRFLAGGLLALGGTSLLGGTQAFSQVDATRATSIQTAGDQNALLGVDPVASVQQGDQGVELVSLTNNTGSTLDVTVSLQDPSQGTVSPSSATIGSGATTTVTVDVASDSPTGTDALRFSVSATDGNDLSVSLNRAVDVMAGPELLWSVIDQSAGNAKYTVQFDVNNVDTFGGVQVSFQSADDGESGWASGTRTASVREGSVSFAPGGGADHEYTITIEVTDGQNVILFDDVTDVADGTNPGGNDDLGGENDPELVQFSVTNEEQNTNNRFIADYEVTTLDQFDRVEVVFDNTEPNEDWADATKQSNDTPTGAVIYPQEGNYQGGVNGDTYEVTAEVFNTSNIVVNSETLEIEAGSETTVSWSDS